MCVKSNITCFFNIKKVINLKPYDSHSVYVQQQCNENHQPISIVAAVDTKTHLLIKIY